MISKNESSHRAHLPLLRLLHILLYRRLQHHYDHYPRPSILQHHVLVPISHGTLATYHQQRQAMAPDERGFTNEGAPPLLRLGSLSMTEMVPLMFEPCSLCPDIDHLIHEVEFHCLYILSTPWTTSATDLDGILPPAVQSAVDAYRRGELSTESEEEETPSVPNVQNGELPTYRDYLETHDSLGQLEDALQTLDRYQPDLSQTELQTVHNCQEWLGVPRATPVNFEKGFSTSHGAGTVLKPDNEEQGVACWRSRIKGFTRVSPGIRRRMGRILG